MTRQEKGLYLYSTQELMSIFRQIAGFKIKLDCGHYLTIRPGNALANDFTVRQGAQRITCSLCAYQGW